MTFADPQLLWLSLVVLPLLTGFLWWAWRTKRTLVAQFVRSRLLANLTVGVSPVRQKIRIALLVFAVASLFIALARPQWGFAWEEAKQRGLDIVVAIDTSRSMLAADVAPNRITRAKLAALDLMQKAKNDRLGLVAFAGTAFLQCPLTLDEDAFRQSVNALDIGIIPQGGTALTDAIRAALGAFKEEGDNHKVLVLFTDGEDHESSALSTAEEAAKAGLRIFTVGVGTAQGELLRQRDEKGAVGFIKDDQGNVVKSRLNETLLQQIATAANGFYLPLRGANTIDVLYEKGLAPLPKSEGSAKLIRRYHERFQWPLALAILLLLAELFMPDRKRVPRSKAIAAAANAELKKAIALFLLCVIPISATASSASALRKYANGQYSEAWQEYKRLLERQPDDPRLHYNAGAAAYQAKQFDQAAQSFGAALASPDLDLQQHAFYNLGNTLYRTGEQISEADKKIEVWEQSVQKFESALKLNPQDNDAQHNLELVRKQLEELKKQQKQQPTSSDKKDQNKKGDQDKQDQKNPQPKDDKSQQDQKSGDSKQDQQPPKPDPNQPDQKPGDEKKAAETKDQEKKDGQEKSTARQKGKDEGQKEANGTEAAVSPGQMTPQQARQILDAQKGEEKALLFMPSDKARANNRVFKDW